MLPEDLCYATVRKRREKGHVVEVVRTLVFGTLALLHMCLGRSTVSTTINTSFVERHNGTDRHQNGRKHRKTYGFSGEMAPPWSHTTCANRKASRIVNVDATVRTPKAAR